MHRDRARHGILLKREPRKGEQSFRLCDGRADSAVPFGPRSAHAAASTTCRLTQCSVSVLMVARGVVDFHLGGLSSRRIAANHLSARGKIRHEWWDGK
jgi:hypothetical protein